MGQLANPASPSHVLYVFSDVFLTIVPAKDVLEQVLGSERFRSPCIRTSLTQASIRCTKTEPDLITNKALFYHLGDPFVIIVASVNVWLEICVPVVLQQVNHTQRSMLILLDNIYSDLYFGNYAAYYCCIDLNKQANVSSKKQSQYFLIEYSLS